MSFLVEIEMKKKPEEALRLIGKGLTAVEEPLEKLVSTPTVHGL